MSKAHWQSVSEEAVKMVEENEAVLKDNPEIDKDKLPYPYSRLDCRKYVQECVKRAGGQMKYDGSNHMFRQACTKIMTLKEAQESGQLHSGCLLFIVEPYNAKTPAKYLADGLGDATHVGLYTDLTNQGTGTRVEVAHSSASREMVCASTLKNAWTHVGWAKCIDYGDGAEDAQQEPSSTQIAIVDVPEGENLRMRETPSANGAYMLKIPRGKELKTTAHQNGFAQVTFEGYTGWVDERYLRYMSEPDAPDTGPGYAVHVTSYKGLPLTEAQARNIQFEYKALGYGVEVVDAWS